MLHFSDKLDMLFSSDTRELLQIHNTYSSEQYPTQIFGNVKKEEKEIQTGGGGDEAEKKRVKGVTDEGRPNSC